MKTNETEGEWYYVERDIIAVITDILKQVSIIEYKICWHLNNCNVSIFVGGQTIRQCSTLMVDNNPTCSLYAYQIQQCNCNTDDCNADQNCACNQGQGSIVTSVLLLIIQPIYIIIIFF